MTIVIDQAVFQAAVLGGAGAGAGTLLVFLILWCLEGLR
jgi:hypothetical protein